MRGASDKKGGLKSWSSGIGEANESERRERTASTSRLVVDMVVQKRK